METKDGDNNALRLAVPVIFVREDTNPRSRRDECHTDRLSRRSRGVFLEARGQRMALVPSLTANRVRLSVAVPVYELQIKPLNLPSVPDAPNFLAAIERARSLCRRWSDSSRGLVMP
jgi:hypothetical protein